MSLLSKEKVSKDLGKVGERLPIAGIHSGILELSYQTYVGMEAVELPGV